MSMLHKVIYFLTILFLSHQDAVYGQSTILDIPLPSIEYRRINIDSSSFGAWLRQLPLKKPPADVLDFNGHIFKPSNDSAVAYVVDLPIQGRRLEQCMDIVVRLYAEYCWMNQCEEELSFPLPGGYWLAWESWEKGFRPEFRGIKMSLEKKIKGDSSYRNFNKFLNTIFNHSHTQQYYHAYQLITREDVQIGDFIVSKGTKGHAVLIVDMAIDHGGNKIALIGNGDTPACEFFLLNSYQKRPWISLSSDRDVLPLKLRRKMTWDGLRRFSKSRHRKVNK